jgi:hypothetical protein
MERRTVEYLFTNDELIDKLHEYGLQFDAVEGCWKADSVDLLRFIGMVEEAYISHYERKLDAM